MEVRNCKFCENPATYAPLERMEVFGIKIFFCHPCQAEYLYFSRQETVNKEPTSVSLYTVVNGKMYRWTRMAGGGVQLWYVKKPGVPGERMNEEMEAVVHIEELETITVTPQNIQSKITVWLPFL